MDILKTSIDWARAELLSNGLFALFGAMFLVAGCCQTKENSHQIARADLTYALNNWRHSVRAADRLILKLSRE